MSRSDPDRVADIMEAADEALDESSPTGASSLERMEAARDVEFVFEPEPEGGYHAYAPELPGLHPQGEDLEEASANAEEALALYVEGMREEGRSLDMGVIRRRVTLPA